MKEKSDESENVRKSFDTLADITRHVCVIEMCSKFLIFGVL